MKQGIGRIGVLIPPGNTAMEAELPKYCPDDVALHFNRLSRHATTTFTTEALLSLNASLERASVDLAEVEPSVIVFGCTSASFAEGRGREARPSERISSATGIPAVTTAMAVVEALRFLKAKSVYVLTPYPRVSAVTVSNSWNTMATKLCMSTRSDVAQGMKSRQ